MFVLAHEYTHALQDQDFGLDDYASRHSKSLDSVVAIKSLIEGEATVLGAAVFARSQGKVPIQVDWIRFASSLWDSTYESVDASMAPLITAAEVFPYPLGSDYIAQRWIDGGQAAIDTMYQHPALTVRDWRHNIDPGKPSTSEPLDCYATTPPTGYTAFDSDTLGDTGVVALRMLMGNPAQLAWTESDAWRGDSLIVFKSDTTADIAVAWRTRWATTSDATTAATAMTHVAALGVHTTIEGNEVTLLLGTDTAFVDTWATAQQCGTQADLPTSPTPQAPANAILRRLTPARAPHGH
jgi:hypothetical protein